MSSILVLLLLKMMMLSCWTLRLLRLHEEVMVALLLLRCLV